MDPVEILKKELNSERNKFDHEMKDIRYYTTLIEGARVKADKIADEILRIEEAIKKLAGMASDPGSASDKSTINPIIHENKVEVTAPGAQGGGGTSNPYPPYAIPSFKKAQESLKVYYEKEEEIFTWAMNLARISTDQERIGYQQAGIIARERMYRAKSALNILESGG